MLFEGFYNQTGTIGVKEKRERENLGEDSTNQLGMYFIKRISVVGGRTVEGSG